MSSNTSPVHFKDMEDAFISDARFKVDISQKMKVPDKISFNTNANGVAPPGWPENINMQVPDRILVVGQDQHVGTRGPPREIVLDNSLFENNPFPTDPRVATPPRTLTLDKYPFPGVDEFEEPEKDEPTPVIKRNLNDGDNRGIIRESTPAIGGGDGLTPAEEVQHLRRQMAKLTRRVVDLEVENLYRLQRDKLLYAVGISYILLKAIFWMNRD